HHKFEQLTDRLRASDQQGLFSTVDHSAFSRWRGHYRFRHRFEHLACDDVLLRSGLDPQLADGSSALACNDVHGARGGYLPLCFDSILSRLSLCRAIYGAVVDVCDTCRLSRKPRSQALAMVTLSQPDVGTD